MRTMRRYSTVPRLKMNSMDRDGIDFEWSGRADLNCRPLAPQAAMVLYPPLTLKCLNLPYLLDKKEVRQE
jgi:hypothetical protein